ncbi:MAG: hypothetical protein ACM37W_23555 [Actinomycetota bacterium]
MTQRNSTEQPPALYNPIIWRLELQNSETPSRDTYIKAFGYLPDFILKANHILPSNLEGNFRRLLNHCREVFKAIQEWILHFERQSNNPLISDPPDLYFSWKIDFKSHAQEAWALLNLCQEIVKRAPFLGKESQEFPIATELWWSCHFERLQEAFFRNGIISQRAERHGKQSCCDEALKRIQEDFNTLHQRRFANSSQIDPTQIVTWDATEEALRLWAEYLAQIDTEFRQKIYPNYIKIQKRLFRSVRNNPNLQLMVLEPDDSLYVGGKSRRGKAKKSSQSNKGFVKKGKD